MSPLHRRRLSNESGFSLVEMLISTAIMLVVTGAIFTLMNPAQGNAQAQPEVADIQQRMRVGTDALFKELDDRRRRTLSGPGHRLAGQLLCFGPAAPRRDRQSATRPRARAVSRPTKSR